MGFGPPRPEKTKKGGFLRPGPCGMGGFGLWVPPPPPPPRGLGVVGMGGSEKPPRARTVDLRVWDPWLSA